MLITMTTQSFQLWKIDQMCSISVTVNPPFVCETLIKPAFFMVKRLNHGFSHDFAIDLPTLSQPSSTEPKARQ